MVVPHTPDVKYIFFIFKEAVILMSTNVTMVVVLTVGWCASGQIPVATTRTANIDSNLQVRISLYRVHNEHRTAVPVTDVISFIPNLFYSTIS